MQPGLQTEWEKWLMLGVPVVALFGLVWLQGRGKAKAQEQAPTGTGAVYFRRVLPRYR